MLAFGELPGPLELDRGAGERVREHVVQLAGDPTALGDRRRAGLLIARVLELCQQDLGPVLALPRLLEELRDDTDQDRTSTPAATADEEPPAAAVTTPSATVTAPPTDTPALNGSRVTAMNTAAPAATPVAPWSWSPAIATPAAPISAITTVCSLTSRSGKPSRTATISVAANTQRASVTASALPCRPGTGWLLALPSTTTSSTAQPSGRSVPRCRCKRS